MVSCRHAAESNVKSSSAFSTHYAFCYDGFLMTDDGQLDAIIVECATTEMEKAYVIARLYRRRVIRSSLTRRPAYVDDVDTFYDLAARACRQGACRGACKEGDEMDEIQQRIQSLLAGDGSKE